jgi:NitT/TauT family transport system ATP-binding protein
VERIYVEITAKPPKDGSGTRAERFPGAGIGTILPRVSSNLLSGLLEAVAGAPYAGEADLPVIAASLQMEIDDLFPVAETLQMLRFAELVGGDIRLTPEGKRFAQANVDERKQLFSKHLLTYVALAAHLRRILDERPSHRAPWSRFSDELEDHMTPAAAQFRQAHGSLADGRYYPRSSRKARRRERDHDPRYCTILLFSGYTVF